MYAVQSTAVIIQGEIFMGYRTGPEARADLWAAHLDFTTGSDSDECTRGNSWNCSAGKLSSHLPAAPRGPGARGGWTLRKLCDARGPLSAISSVPWLCLFELISSISVVRGVVQW